MSRRELVSSPSPATLSEHQVKEIFERATRLQSDPGQPRERDISMAEVESIAHEAGIDVALVRRATIEITHCDRQTPAPSRFLGAPTTILLHAIVEGEVPDAAYEDFVTLARRHIGEHGSHDRAGRSFCWASFIRPASHGASTRQVKVTVTTRHGATTIVVEERMAPLAWALFGGLIGGMGGGGVGLFVGPLIAMGMPMLIPLGLIGWFGGAFAMARALYRRRTAKRTDELKEMLREMVQAAEDHIVDALSARC